MAAPFKVHVNYVELTTVIIGWPESGPCEEVLGGAGAANFTVQDRDATGFDPEPHYDVKITLASGWVLFHGEIVSATFTVQAPSSHWVEWTISCRDYNAQLGERLLGAPNGTFWRPGEQFPYQVIDAAAISGATDQVTVQDWFAAYFQFPDTTTAETSTYVHEYIPNSFLGALENIMWLYDAQTTLQGALEELAGMADVNIQFWLDPDDNFHWARIPTLAELASGDIGNLASFPVAVGGAAAGYAKVLNEGRLVGTKDGAGMFQNLYAQGATTYVQDQDTGQSVAGGSGWYSGPNKPYRQAYLATPGAWTEARRNELSAAATVRASTYALRASFQTRGTNDGAALQGWRVGQVILLEQSRIPASLRVPATNYAAWVIQRVVTTFAPGDTLPTYTIDVGDGPVGRMGQYASRDWNLYHPKVTGPNAKKAADIFDVVWDDIGPVGHGERHPFHTKPGNGYGLWWSLPGQPVSFVVHAFDADDNEVTDSTATTDPVDTFTDQQGTAYGVLVSDETRDDLAYDIEVLMAVVPA